MDCREVTELLPDLFQKSLRGEQLRLVEEHVRACATCREDVALWEQLAALPAPPPSPLMQHRFEAMLESYQQGRRELEVQRHDRTPRWFGAFVQAPFAQAAIAASLVLVAFFGGMFVERSGGTSKEIASLHRELTSTRQLVALSLLQQQSASDRLQGVSWSTRVEGDPEVLAALMHTLRFDTSVDVRLAALDALRRYTDQPAVRTGVEDSLQSQRSPLVQIAVVDFLVEQRDRRAVEKLRNFQQMPNLLPEVKERVARGIDQLSRG